MYIEKNCCGNIEENHALFEGVFTTTIDPQQHKVTVTGSVGVETLLRKLVRAGKHAEIWPENLDGNVKSSGKAKKKKNGERVTERLENHSDENKGTESAVNCNDSESKKSSNPKAGDTSPEKPPAGNMGPPEEEKGGQSEGGGGGSGKKKKKKKGQSGGNGSNGSSSATNSVPAHTGSQFQNHVGQQMGQMNLSPTRQLSYSYPETGYPPMVYVAATYNRLFPMGRMGSSPSYYVPPSPYMCAGLDQDTYYQLPFQSTPLISFEIFSDENANGCHIM